MFMVKKTAGNKKAGYNDYQYAIQELNAAKIKFEYYAINPEGGRAEIGKAKKGASYHIQVIKNGCVYFSLSFNSESRAVYAFESIGKRRESFKRHYVANYGALVKRDGFQWSIGKIMGLILSYFESARLESEANKMLRQQDKKAADGGSE